MNSLRNILSLALVLLVVVVFFLVSRQQPHISDMGTFTPDQAPSADTAGELEARRLAQEAQSGSAAPPHDFKFTDVVEKSNITFLGKVINVPASEYGHGMGVAAADVDNDGLTDLFFAGQVDGNELWRNLGGGSFENFTDRSSADIAMHDSVNLGVAFADYDNSGTADLLVTTVRKGLRLFSNDGAGHFVDVTETAGLVGTSGNLSGAVFFDYDNDGWLDLFVSSIGGFTSDTMSPEGYYLPVPRSQRIKNRENLIEGQRLFKNVRGVFSDVSAKTGIAAIRVWSGDVAPGDLNGDGFVDLVVLDMQGMSVYLENLRGEGFKDRTRDRLGLTPAGAMGAKFFDFNNDGAVDLYITDMHSDMSYGRPWQDEKLKSHGPFHMVPEGVRGNAFYLGGTPSLREVSDQVGAETYWPWGISAGDINADGYVDAFVTGGMGAPWRYGINSMLLNDAGLRFVDSEFLLGIEPRARGAFARGTSTVSSRSSLVFDIENDGDLDIVTNDFHWALPQLLTSDLAQRMQINFLKVKLRGMVSSRDGLGSKVVVRAGSLTSTQWHDGKSGYFAQSSLPLYFGLGSDANVDSVEVYWPSGIVQLVTQGIPRNGMLTIIEQR